MLADAMDSHNAFEPPRSPAAGSPRGAIGASRTATATPPPDGDGDADGEAVDGPPVARGAVYEGDGGGGESGGGGGVGSRTSGSGSSSGGSGSGGAADRDTGEATWFEPGERPREDQSLLESFNTLAKYQARTLAPGKIVLHSVAKDIADRHRELAHQCTQDSERKNIVAHLQAFLMNDRVMKALKEPRAPYQPSKPAVLERSTGELHVVWSPHPEDRDIDPLHFEICWGFRFTGAWSKCMCTISRHLITGLKPGTNYQVRVRAYNARGYGPMSEMATISTAKSGGGGGQQQQQQMKKPGLFGIFKAIPAGYDELVNSVIRPPRGVYDIEELGAFLPWPSVASCATALE
jgi:hypothetical protein